MSVIGNVMMISITIILATILLLMCLGIHILQADDVPDIFKIVNIDHYDKNGKMDFNSYVTLKNVGKRSYLNRYLSVKLFVNGVPSNAKLPTLNGEAFCNSDHTGIKNIGGLGVRGNVNYATSRWYEGQELFIDFNDGTFHPDDTIRIEVYDTSTGQILSRDTYPPEKKYTVKWFYNYFLNPQVA
ncbi:MAG: hypothetical protein A4E34_02449 [Methanoregula sp. PtaU1.Bin006]|nr:MAG: hypothetical protein A4E33_00196 [Methanoregula sp. PtaB.Bin085]OPY32077.1 MAG: hypothetical protein A4E34_02449 [Methanoregula sp. PtaU1.Bin006]